MIISLADYFLGCISLTPNRLNQQGKNIRYCVYFPTSGIRAWFYCLGIVIGVGLKMEESSGAGMIRLTSSNYSIWKPRMEDILYCKDLYAPIDGDKSKPKDMSEAEWKIMHRKQ